MTVWLLYQTGTWHAWRLGGDRTLCGHLTTVHLREAPARRVIDGDLPYALRRDACATCLRLARLSVPAPVDMSTDARDWLGLLRRRTKLARLRVVEADLCEFAERLAALGPISDPTACDVYEHVASLLLRPVYVTGRDGRRTSTVIRLRPALDHLPPRRPDVLLHIAEGVRLWRRLTGRELERDKYNVARVVETMLEVPALEPYIERLNARGLPHLAAMFHPNTLERAKTDTALRGTFRFADAADYSERALSEVEVVTE